MRIPMFALHKALAETCINCGELKALCNCGNFQNIYSDKKRELVKEDG